MTSVTIHTSLGSIHTSCCVDLGNSIPWRAEKLWDISHEGHNDQEIGILKILLFHSLYQGSAKYNLQAKYSLLFWEKFWQRWVDATKLE